MNVTANKEFTTADAIRSLMNEWNKTRAAWLKAFGTEDRFSEWFTDHAGFGNSGKEAK